MKCLIDGEVFTFTKDDIEVSDCYKGVKLVTLERRQFIVAENSEVAGKAARKYWEDMAENDPNEFTCMVGQKTLICWGLGKFAGPGSTQVQSLEEWLDLWLNTPEDHFAAYDNTERDITFEFSNPSKKDTPERINEVIEDIFDFVPTVAYAL